MLTLASLWLPIVLTAVGVFIASSLIHMVIQWHKGDYLALTNEDAVRAVIAGAKPKPGQYVVPYCPGGKEMQAPEMQKKFIEGPIAIVTVRESGLPKMGKFLGQWFALTLVVALLTAGLSCTVLKAGADVHVVFHFFAIVTFMTYACGSFVNGIWMGKLWSAVARDCLDSLIYALVTAAIFAWLWPQ